MRLARVVGTVTGTMKDHALTGKKLLLVDLVDSSGAVVDSDQVAVDTVGAGAGDLVLVAGGSAARQAASAIGLPTDLAVVMIVDELTAERKTEGSGGAKKGK
ncbi:propanediol utilization microcompartment protein PduN [soil metagenome]